MKQALIIILIFVLWQTSAIAQVQDSLKFPVSLTVDQFKERVSNKNKMVLVNFSANWCVMCKKQKPILQEIQKEKKEVLEILVIDMDDNPLIAEYFNVDGLPINLLYKNGQLVWDRAGFKSKIELITQISYFE